MNSQEIEKVQQLLDAIKQVEATSFDKYTAGNGRKVGIQTSEGEKCQIVPCESLDALSERAEELEKVIAGLTPSAPGAGVASRPTRYTTGPSIYTKEYASQANNIIGGVKQLLKVKIAKLERTKYEDLSDSSDATLKAYKEILSLLDAKEKTTTPRDVPDMGREEAAREYATMLMGAKGGLIPDQQDEYDGIVKIFLAGADWQSRSASKWDKINKRFDDVLESNELKEWLKSRSASQLEVIEAAKDLIDSAAWQYKAHNGKMVSIEADGEKCMIVPSEKLDALKTAITK